MQILFSIKQIAIKLKVIQTDIFKKIAGSWDDQANFWKRRDNKDQGETIFIPTSPGPDSEYDIKKKWKTKKKLQPQTEEETEEDSIPERSI